MGYNGRFGDSTLGENESCILLNSLALVKIARLLLPEVKRHPRAFVLNVASLAVVGKHAPRSLVCSIVPACYSKTAQAASSAALAPRPVPQARCAAV